MNSLKHLGIIMDGNRRWAKKNGFKIFQGHDAGANILVNTCEWCIQEKINFLTVYAFSTENWQRSPVEVMHIFDLLEKFFIEKINFCIENQVRIKIIGDRNKLDNKTLEIINKTESQTKDLKALNLQIALNYGGRNEIIRAIKKLVHDIILKKILLEEISEESFSLYLDTKKIPDVDLVIRTGGINNRRLSNFLPWQTVYSELFFSDLLWPEFSQQEFKNAIDYYNSITKKHGK